MRNLFRKRTKEQAPCMMENLEPRLMLSTAPYTVIALPDTQYYSATLPHIYESQTQWVADWARVPEVSFAYALTL